MSGETGRRDSGRRRILLAVTGLSPQVVTETVFALARRRPPWIPHEVQVITTADGAERLRLALLSADRAWFRRLLDDWELPPVAFDSDRILVVTDARGQPLRDIRTPADNERVADFICEHVRGLTADPGTELHASIAGGRKTMGYYLGYALSLFGRPRDRLSHVLVSDPYESSWGFFYPTPYSSTIETRDGNLADTRDARVTLAEIPFVSLRHGLDQRLLEGKSTFSEVVAAARRALAPPELHIDLSARRVRAAGTSFALPPAQLALLTLFVRRALAGAPPLEAPPKEVGDTAWAERFLAEYDRVGHVLDDHDRTRHALRRGMDGAYFSTLKSKLHRSLDERLGKAVAAAYRIDDRGTRPRRYALRLPPEAIRIDEGRGPGRKLAAVDEHAKERAAWPAGMEEHES